MPKKETLGTTKVTYKYQITIPKPVRDSCGFKEGDLLVFEKEDGRLFLRDSRDT